MSSITSELQRAVELHRNGDIPAAEQAYHKILRLDPRQADALHLLGVAAHQCRRSADAVGYIRRAIAINDRCAQYHCNLGLAQRSVGELDAALGSFQTSVEIDPGFAGGYYNLAKTLESLGRTDDAIASYRNAIGSDPLFAEAHNNLGLLLSARGRLSDAIESFRAAAAARPESAEFHYNLANTFAAVGQHEDAVAAYEQAVRCDATIPEFHNNLGATLLALDRAHEAAVSFREALRIRSHFAEAHNNLGSALHLAGDLDGAADAFRCAITEQPNFPGALVNLGNVANESGDLGTAVEYYERAIKLDPQSPQANFNRALALLRSGDFVRGWAAYEWRWKRKVSPRDFVEPVWQGELLTGRTILAYAEQGIGDEIQFAGCLPDLFANSERVVIECDPRLVPLFARSFPQASVLGRPIARDSIDRRVVPHVDYCVAFGSIPRIVRNSSAAFPDRKKYLAADSSRIEQFRARLNCSRFRMNVGISWRGGSEPDVQRKRSISLIDWRDILLVDGVNFQTLQHGKCQDELHSVATHYGIAVAPPAIDCWNDLDSLAANIAALDLVITVDNSTAHLAGALGVPVWTLLPFASDWRWMTQRDTTLWYPSMRLFRQTSPGDWQPVLRQVAAHLRRRCESRPEPDF